MQASTLTTYFRMEGNQIGRAMQGRARQGRARKKATVHGEEIVRLRWSVARGLPWEGRGRYPGTYWRGYGDTAARRYEGTKARCEGAKRNGAMNRRQGKRATGAYCANHCSVVRSAARIDTVQRWSGPPLSLPLLPLSPAL